ncbi:MAG: fluoride efflux transporter CrcB [Pseudomonadota bacterium]
MASALLAVFLGAGLGACLRYVLGESLNHLLPQVPLGTLAANLIGGYLVGVAIGLFAWRADLSLLWRLALITGFLGGLTTFSTYSAEVVDAFARGEVVWALVIAVSHLAGSLLLTVLGLATVRALITP